MKHSGAVATDQRQEVLGQGCGSDVPDLELIHSARSDTRTARMRV